MSELVYSQHIYEYGALDIDVYFKFNNSIIFVFPMPRAYG